MDYSTCSHSVLSTLFVEDAVFCQVCISGYFDKKYAHRCVNLCLGLQFHSNDQCICFCTCTILVVYNYSSVVQFEIRDGDAFSTSFIIQDCFATILGVCMCVCVCMFPYKGENCPFMFVKYFIGMFMVTELNM